MIQTSVDAVEDGTAFAGTYLIDANCLMTPHNDYYDPSYSLSSLFWNRLNNLVMQGTVILIEQVVHEVRVKGTDFLNTWLDSVQPYILHTQADAQIVGTFGAIMNFVQGSPDFSKNAKNSWMKTGVADPWLVATAAVRKAKIVTFEKYVPINPGQPAAGAKIPNVAEQYEVQCMTLFDFMRRITGF